MTSDPTIPAGATSFTPAQVEILRARAIDPDVAWLAGVTSVQVEADLPDGAPDYWTVEAGYLPGLLFRYVGPTGEAELQLRPDTPVTREVDGRTRTAKYVFAKGARSVLHVARDVPEARNLLIVEGTCQAIAAGRYAPPGWAVYGIAGCQSWMQDGVPMPDLSVVDGRRVFVVLDADGGSNRAVYDAGERLARALLMHSAEEVRFVRLPASGKSGLDDVLAGSPPDRRTRLLEGLLRTTADLGKGEKPGLPARKRPDPKATDDSDGGSPFFADGAGLLVEQLAQDIVDSHPIALTADNRLALYRDGVFGPGDLGVLSAVTERLGDQFRREHAANVESFMTGEAARLGWRLAERQEHPLVNLTNGMLDLRTGELKPHHPKYRSTVQLPVAWDPDAAAPVYEAWLETCAGPGQIEDLEESISVMLDPTVTPSKAVFLFGPSRSGKSTLLRLMKEVAGGRNTSGVSLHQLVENRFMAARVFGKMLNISADLSAAHLDDLSIFKLMTGEDVVEADPKFGRPFTFTNRALFAFSANELPTVGESSRAYSERIRPFLFGNTFAGAEDEELFGRLVVELPGILVRWVAAYRRLRARGRPLETDAAVRETFEIESDRVRKWFAERLEVVEGDGLVIQGGMTRKELAHAFKSWAEENGGHQMAMGKIVTRLLNLPLVADRRDGTRSKVRVLNVRVRPEADWGTETKRTEEVADGGRGGGTEPLCRGDSSYKKNVVEVSQEGSRPVSPPTPPTPIDSPPVDSAILKGIKALSPVTPPSYARCPVCGAALELVLNQLLLCPDRHLYIPEVFS